MIFFLLYRLHSIAKYISILSNFNSILFPEVHWSFFLDSISMYKMVKFEVQKNNQQKIVIGEKKRTLSSIM